MAQTKTTEVRKGDQWDAALRGRLPGGGMPWVALQVSGVSAPTAKLAPKRSRALDVKLPLKHESTWGAGRLVD